MTLLHPKTLERLRRNGLFSLEKMGGKKLEPYPLTWTQ